MLVIFLLSQKSNSSLCLVWIFFWHVNVINEIDELGFARWLVSSTSFLDQVFLEDLSEEIGISVVVHVNNLLQVVFFLVANKFLKQTFDDLGLTTTS
jgi:hypothetical protein